MTHAQLKTVAVAVVSLALLLGAGADRLRVRPSADASDYHRRVRAASSGIPLQFGDWTGTDVPLAYDAARMLRPNVLIYRDYEQAQTGQHICFLLIQCEDALALGGHYPPNCYPSAGYIQLSQEPRTWHTGDMAINGSEYVFARGPQDVGPSVTIANFLMLADGSSTSDMNAVFMAASNLRSRFYGGAEVQVVMNSGLGGAERQQIIEQFLDAARGTLATIASANEPKS